MEREFGNPFVFDSGEPEGTRFRNFLAGEVRYACVPEAGIS
jgi:hypothetical protein